MTTRIEISESARHYYGQILQSGNDPKTSACCSIDVVVVSSCMINLSPENPKVQAEHIQLLGGKSRHFGLFDCKPAPQGDAACC